MNNLFTFLLLKPRLAMIAFVFMMALFQISKAQTVASCTDNDNLTQNVDVTATGPTTEPDSGHGADALIDGNASDDSGTRWVNSGLDNSSFTAEIDLKAIYPVGKIILSPYKDRPYLYTVEVSTDDEHYFTLVDRSEDSPGGDSIVNEFNPVAVRYVRLTVLGCKDDCSSYSSINELSIICANPESSEPIVNITKPGDGSVVDAAGVNFNVSSFSLSDEITYVAFYEGTDSLGVDSTAVYEYQWTPSGLGQKEIIAKAYDSEGNLATDTAEVLVTNFPEVSILNKGQLSAIASYESLPLQVSATDADGSITAVEFFDNGMKTFTDSLAPYEHTIEEPALGYHQIVAMATDNNGAVSSDTLDVAVISAPSDDEFLFEAEHYDSVTNGMIKAYDIDASNDSTIYADFKDNNYPPSTKTDGVARYKLDLPESQHYNVYARIHAKDGGSNSCFVQLNSNGWDQQSFGSYGVYHWTKIASGTLSAGDNVLYIARRESHTKIDKIIVTPRDLKPSGKEGIVYDPGGIEFNPRVILEGVSDSATVVKDAGVQLSVIGEDINNDVDNIKIFADGIEVVASTNDTATFAPGTLDAGYHTLKALVTDSKGNTAEDSLVVNVLVGPSVDITNPSDSSSIELGATETIIATATDDGSIVKVDFYVDNELMATDSSSAYTYTFSGQTTGDVEIVAVGTDDDKLTNSDTILVSVEKTANFLSISSPTSDSIFTQGDDVEILTSIASDNGIISKVDFYANGDLSGSSTEKPFKHNVNNVSAGELSVYAKGYSDTGVLVSHSDTVTATVEVGANAISITQPGNNTVFSIGSDITIALDIQNDDGSITKAIFYEGENEIGESTSKPFSFTWTSVEEGTYYISAVGLDDEGGIVAESQQININVRELTAGENGMNPIAQFYGGSNGYPGWTDEIQWNNVIDMSTYDNGANDFEKFENARDELYEQGGGVLYYPGGTYDFSDHPTGPSGRGLMLKKGVVIMGDAPAEDANAIAVDRSTYDESLEFAHQADQYIGLKNLPTKFIFPFEERDAANGTKGEVPDVWNIIGVMPDKENGERISDVTHIGVAWIDIQGATVYMGPDMTHWGDTYATSESWQGQYAIGDWASRKPDGTFIFDPFCGSRQNDKDYIPTRARFVFGCRFNDAAALNNRVIDHTKTGANPEFLVTARFASRITMYGADLFVANNALPPSDKNFKYQQLTDEGEKTLLFDYGRVQGIELNKQLAGQCGNYNAMDESSCAFQENVIVQDNFVYNHGHKGIEAVGKYLVVKNNVNYRHYCDGFGGGGDNGLADNVYDLDKDYPDHEGWYYSYDGYRSSDGSTDMFARAFDVGGQNMWVHNNWYTGVGSNPANDGEGILIQRWGGIEAFSVAFTYNYGGKEGGGPFGTGYIAPYDVHILGMLQGWNETRDAVGTKNPKQSHVEELSLAKNTHVATGEPSEVQGKEGVNVDERTFIDTCPEEPIVAPKNVSVINDNGKFIINWEDNSDNEMGFRIDRKFGDVDNWTAIAYRPMNMKDDTAFTYTGHDAINIPEWYQENGSVTMDFNVQEWVDYTAPAGLDVNYRVVAINCDDEGGVSDTVTTINPIKVAAPEFSLPSGNYQETVKVALSSSTPDAVIHYTLDGSEPDESSPVYSDSLTINTTTTIKAIAVKGQNEPSEIVSGSYTIEILGIGNGKAEESVKLYPNPSESRVNIAVQSSGKGVVLIAVIDQLGVPVRQFSFKKIDYKAQTTLDLKGLSAGIYHVRVFSPNGVSTHKMVVK